MDNMDFDRSKIVIQTAASKDMNEIHDDNDVVCKCRRVTDEHIRAAVRAGARTLDKVKEETGCGKVCGLCVEDVQRIIADARSKGDTGEGKGSFNLQ